jgi:uncharacterized protein YndB with AHSA1/START domain
MTENPDARLVRLEIEVPGTPEQVWEAIATGPGIACWFVPAEVDGREGGRVVTHHGPFGDSEGVVTAWEPPHRFAYQESEWAEGAPPWATEFLVEARGGGTCVVRLVSGLFSNAADWSDEIEGSEGGWTLGLDNLRIYLTHFAGEPCSHIWAMARTTEPLDRAQAALHARLGLEDAAVGERVSAAAGAPALAGVVESRHDGTVLVRADEPGRGVVEAFAHRWDDHTNLTVRLYLYGEDAAAVAEREGPAWQAWIERHAAVPEIP